MSVHESQGRGLPDDVLAEGGRVRLKQLQRHMTFLSRLARASTSEAGRERMSGIGVEEMAAGLDFMAEHLGLVLGEPCRPARAQPMKEMPLAEEGRARGAEGPGRAAAVEADPAQEEPDGVRERFIFGMALEQVDALDRLIRRISAHGDAMAAGRADEWAPGTLPQLGEAVRDAAEALRGILDCVERQRLGQAGGRFGVREAPAAYRVRLGRCGGGSHRSGAGGRSRRVARPPMRSAWAAMGWRRRSPVAIRRR